MTNLNRIGLFVRVVESASFSSAARQLGMPTSSLSRAIAALEAELGVRLLHRTTRKLSLTDAGHQYYAAIRGAVGAIDEANAAASQQSREPRGTVRLTTPADMANPFFMEIIAEFVRKYPQVHVDLVMTNRRVNMIEDGIDLAVRAGPLGDSSLMARRIGQTELGLYAARSYIDEHGQPRTLAQLHQHACVLMRGGNSGLVPWRLTGPRGAEEVHPQGRVTVDGINATLAAVSSGLGIGMLPTLSLPGEATGNVELVRVLPRYAHRGGPLSLLWSSSKHMPRHVALLRDHLADRMAKVMAHSTRRG